MPIAPEFQSEFLRTFVARGAYYDSTAWERLDALFLKERVTAYIGFDCTADSLHVGSLVQLMTLRRLQQAGHKPILLMGGGTTKIGDPSGKDESRKILTNREIRENKESILSGIKHLLKFGDGPTDAIVVDNAEWLDNRKYIPFLRNVGRYFSVNRMLDMESVKQRLDREQPLSFLEFNYSILQAFDFVQLYEKYGCKLQASGSDQWGNIIAGIDLGHKMVRAELFGLTTPLITTASGAKMGKTAAGAVWLNSYYENDPAFKARKRKPNQTSYYDYWQFWRNTEDRDVGRFLRLFTDMPLREIVELEAQKGSDLNTAKKILADEATAILHGRDAANKARAVAESAFEKGTVTADLPPKYIDVGPNEEWRIGRSNTAFIVAAGFAKSNSDARNKMKEGVTINGRPVVDPNEIVRWIEADPNTGGFIIRHGRKNIALVKPK